MPINAYSGLMRSGKSFEVVSMVIIPALAEGRDIVTNIEGIDELKLRSYVAEKNEIPLEKVGKITVVSNDEVFSDTFFPYYDDERGAHTNTRVQPGDLVCIDEAWRFWGEGCKLHKNHKSFFLEHGHFTHAETGVCCDLVLMIQDMATLHRFLRNVVAFSFRTHKKVSLGMNNTYSVTMYEGWKQISKCRTGEWVRRYRSEIFPLYSSFKGGVQGKVVNVDKRQNIMARKKLWATLIACLFLTAFVIYAIIRFFNPNHSSLGQKPTELTKGASAAPIPNKSVNGAKADTHVPSVSAIWRVAGEMIASGEKRIVLVSPSGEIRIESPSLFANGGYAIKGELAGEVVSSWSGGSISAPSKSSVVNVAKFGEVVQR